MAFGTNKPVSFSRANACHACRRSAHGAEVCLVGANTEAVTGNEADVISFIGDAYVDQLVAFVELFTVPDLASAACARRCTCATNVQNGSQGLDKAPPIVLCCSRDEEEDFQVSSS